MFILIGTWKRESPTELPDTRVEETVDDEHDRRRV